MGKEKYASRRQTQSSSQSTSNGLLCLAPKRTSEQNQGLTHSSSCFCVITINSTLLTSPCFVRVSFKSVFHPVPFPNQSDSGGRTLTAGTAPARLYKATSAVRQHTCHRAARAPEVRANHHPFLLVTTCKSHCWNSRIWWSLEELVGHSQRQLCQTQLKLSEFGPRWTLTCSHLEERGSSGTHGAEPASLNCSEFEKREEVSVCRQGRGPAELQHGSSLSAARWEGNGAAGVEEKLLFPWGTAQTLRTDFREE